MKRLVLGRRGRNIDACVNHFVGNTLESSHVDRGAVQRAEIESVGVAFAASRLFT